MTYKLYIDRTGRSSMKSKPQRFDTETKNFKTVSQLNKFVKESYGSDMGIGQDIFIDTKKGYKKIGKIKSLGWQRDLSHNEPERWFQQDWLSVHKFVEHPVDLDLLRKKMKRKRK